NSKASPHNCVCGLRPIFRPIRAGIKGGNTYSIPALLSLSYEAKSLAECACQIVRCCPKKDSRGDVVGRPCGDLSLTRRRGDRSTWAPASSPKPPGSPDGR